MAACRQMTETGDNRVLVVGPAWVGDMVMAHSLIQTIANDPVDSPQIDVLAPGWALPLTARMAEVSDSIVAPFAHGELNLRGRLQLAQHIRARDYQHCIVLPNSLKSSLLPFAARIPKRTGFVGEQRYGLLNDIRKLNKKKLPLTVHRFCALGVQADAPAINPIPTPQLTVHADEALNARERFALPSDGPILVLCPGAEFGPSKQWPVTHYAELAERRTEAGWNVWILGSSNDASVGAGIVDHVQRRSGSDRRIANLCGLTNLGEAIDLLSLANAVVSNDSGLMHVACAVGAPVLALFGSTTPAMTPPLGHQHTVLQRTLDCRPCFKRECPLGHLDCLNKITADRADLAIDSLLDESSSSK